ncbi:hypothetical protein Tco_1556396 [Tanacetum coccineum]
MVASDNEVKQFYKPSSKPEVGFSNPNSRPKVPPPRRANNFYPQSKTPQPKRNVGRQNQPHGFPVTWNNFPIKVTCHGKCVFHYHIPTNCIKCKGWWHYQLWTLEIFEDQMFELLSYINRYALESTWSPMNGSRIVDALKIEGNQKLFSTYKAYNGGNVIFGSNLRGNIIGKGS